MAFQVLKSNVAAQSASASASFTQEIGVVPSTESETSWTVVRASITTQTAVTGAGASGAGATANIRQIHGGTGGTITTLATQQFKTGTNTVAEEEFTFTISSSSVAAGDVIDFQWVQGGTGLALPASEVQVEIE